jgi:hypothetical protein
MTYIYYFNMFPFFHINSYDLYTLGRMFCLGLCVRFRPSVEEAGRTLMLTEASPFCKAFTLTFASFFAVAAALPRALLACVN